MPEHTDSNAQELRRPTAPPRRVAPLTVRLLLLLTLCLAALPFTAHVAGATAFAVSVTTLSDTNNGACASTGVPPCSLREAIQFANGKNDGDTVTITLPAGTYNLTLLGAGEDNNATGDLDIHRNVNLVGANAATTIIDGNGGDRVLHIFSNTVVNVSGVTIQHGKIDNNGGGVYSEGGALTLNDCVIKENSGGHGGGGVYSSGALTLTNTTVSDNTVTGIAGYESSNARGGGIFAFGSLKLTGSKVLTNQANGVNSGTGFGGGIYTANGTTLLASAVQDNTATGGPVAPASGQGGGIYHDNNSLTLTEQRHRQQGVRRIGWRRGLRRRHRRQRCQRCADDHRRRRQRKLCQRHQYLWFPRRRHQPRRRGADDHRQRAEWQ